MVAERRRRDLERLWRDAPDGWMLSGAALIVASGLFIMYRERDVVRREGLAYGGILELLIERRAGRRVYFAHAELGGEYRQAVLRFAT